jgi:signal transduction histidine kinase
LNEFLTRFLELGRPIALQRQATDLRDLVRRAVETALAGTEGRVEVREQFADNCPPVSVDSAQLLHALLNVTLNAVQAMPDGGILEVGVERHDGVATLAVSDSGAGIDPERQASLFRPFASGRTGGSGLGLAIVKRIVEAHGGSVELKSESGKGTTVTIDLPVG